MSDFLTNFAFAHLVIHLEISWCKISDEAIGVVWPVLLTPGFVNGLLE